MAQDWTSVVQFLNKEKETVWRGCTEFPGRRDFSGRHSDSRHKSIRVFLMFEQTRNGLNRYVNANK